MRAFAIIAAILVMSAVACQTTQDSCTATMNEAYINITQKNSRNISGVVDQLIKNCNTFYFLNLFKQSSKFTDLTCMNKVIPVVLSHINFQKNFHSENFTINTEVIQKIQQLSYEAFTACGVSQDRKLSAADSAKRIETILKQSGYSKLKNLKGEDYIDEVLVCLITFSKSYNIGKVIYQTWQSGDKDIMDYAVLGVIFFLSLSGVKDECSGVFNTQYLPKAQALFHNEFNNYFQRNFVKKF